MVTVSFVDISNHNWQPITAYQTIQDMIQKEVEQGLWANQAHPDGWCCINTSSLHGVNNSWVTHTYQLVSNVTQTISVIWPSGWPSPAENVNGELPSHFFATTTTSTTTTMVQTESIDSGTVTTQPLHETCAAPASQPGYKPARLCG